jgi:hypothetical protein
MPRPSRSLSRLILLGCLAASVTAHADEEPARLKLSGFGTLGIGYHGSDGLEYRRTTDQSQGVRGGHLDAGTDSVLGVQLNASITDQFDAVIQAVSRRRSDSSSTPDITWAFLRYSPDESLEVRLGRVGTAAQINSDSRLIGYSFLPVRLPPELLGTAPQDHVDGIDIAYRHPMGDTLLSVRGFLGQQTAHIHSIGRSVSTPNNEVAGLILGAVRGDLQLRIVAGAARVKNNGDGQGILDGLRATGMNQAIAAASRLDIAGRMIHFGSADVSYEHGPLRLLGSAFLQTAPDDSALLVPIRSAYFLAGYRVGAFTPYVAAARSATSGVTFTTGLPPAPGLTILDQAATAAVVSTQCNQRSLALGVRWDFATNRALKLQVDRVHADQSPLVRDDQTPARDQRQLTLISATLDFVF